MDGIKWLLSKKTRMLLLLLFIKSLDQIKLCGLVLQVRMAL